MCLLLCSNLSEFYNFPIFNTYIIDYLTLKKMAISNMPGFVVQR